MELKITGKYSMKPYQCSECGAEKNMGSNHWGDIYPYCNKCNKTTVFNCLEPVPEGYTKPKPWKLVKLSDVCEIK